MRRFRASCAVARQDGSAPARQASRQATPPLASGRTDAPLRAAACGAGAALLLVAVCLGTTASVRLAPTPQATLELANI